MSQETYQTNKMTQMICDEMVPFSAIIAYGNNASEYYLEMRNIDEQGRMGAGKPLTDEFIGKLIKTLATNTEEIDSSIHGVMPSNILYCDTRVDHERLVWYRPREKRFMFFSASANMPNGEIEVPPMVYSADKRLLSVYCFKGSKPKCKLYRAPFYNVSDNGVCLGSAKLKYPTERTFESLTKYWEDMFWKSEFAHILGGNPIKGNLSTITKKCIKKGIPFPEDVMIPSHKTLKELLK